MRITLIIVVAALLVAACAGASPDGVAPGDDGSTPVVTSPVTTSPVTTSPVTTSPVAGGDTILPGEGEPTVTTQPTKESTVTPSESVVPGSADPVAAVIADLADRLAIDEASITVVSVEEVTWPDGSLGCPQPGMRYTQQVVNGTLYVLEADGVRYEYHSGVGRNPFYCADPTAPVTGDYGDV